jgi:hypothetical protein
MNPGTIYWMDVITYTYKTIMKIKVPNWGTPKHIYLQQLTQKKVFNKCLKNLFLSFQKDSTKPMEH